MKKFISIAIVFMLLLLFSPCALSMSSPKSEKIANIEEPLQEPSGKIFSGLGVALTPRNFPNHIPQDVEDMFKEGKELGNYAVFIYQWSQPDLLNTAKTMMQFSKKYDLKPIIAISPTILGGLRDQWDVPLEVQKKAGNNLSFSNPQVHKPFINTAVELARLKPSYLCLATEINLLAFKNIQEYLYFAHVYKKLYPVIKKISPDTKVFVSFQWDYMIILDDKEPGKIKEHSKLIDVFRPELDLVALTTYPKDHFIQPVDIPLNYYSRIYDHVSKSDTIMFMEIGWPARQIQDYNEQTEFIMRLPTLMDNIKPEILAWSLLHDVGTAQLTGNLAYTGLITKNGPIKPALKAFKELKNK